MIRKVSEKRLRANGGKMYSSISKKPSRIKKRPRSQIRKVNPKAKAKRVARYRKMLQSKEYKAARAEALERAFNQCECWMSWTEFHHPTDAPVALTCYTAVLNATLTRAQRCEARTDLQAHHIRYPKSRPIEARDLTICCKPHHEYLESQKLHKTRMF